jgi:hypothetical protein
VTSTTLAALREVSSCEYAARPGFTLSDPVVHSGFILTPSYSGEHFQLTGVRRGLRLVIRHELVFSSMKMGKNDFDRTIL